MIVRIVELACNATVKISGTDSSVQNMCYTQRNLISPANMRLL